jgi:hypothetical protein
VSRNPIAGIVGCCARAASGQAAAPRRWLPPWPPTPRRGFLNDHCDLSANEFGRQRWQPIDLIVGPAIVDGHVLALDKACVFQALAE